MKESILSDIHKRQWGFLFISTALQMSRTEAIWLPTAQLVQEPAWSAGGRGDIGLIPGLRRSPGIANSNLFQYCCLGNLMDREPGGLQSIGLQRVGHN